MKKITFENLCVGGKCNLFHHGEAIDLLQKISFELYEKTVYGVIGEFGNGGAALSCGITGHTNYYEGTVYIDNKMNTIGTVINSSWYVGSDLSRPRHLLRGKLTVKEQIEYGIRVFKREIDCKGIQDIFQLSDERINRNIERVSGERWKMSAAIGYANGKEIFCYPWLNTKDIMHLREQMEKTIKSLIELGCIVIVPTTKEENITEITQDYNIIQK